MKIKCTNCQTMNDYSEQTLLALLLRGLNDMILDKCMTDHGHGQRDCQQVL